MLVKIKDNRNHIYFVVPESQAPQKIRLLARKHPTMQFTFNELPPPPPTRCFVL